MIEEWPIWSERGFFLDKDNKAIVMWQTIRNAGLHLAQ